MLQWGRVGGEDVEVSGGADTRRCSAPAAQQRKCSGHRCRRPLLPRRLLPPAPAPLSSPAHHAPVHVARVEQHLAALHVHHTGVGVEVPGVGLGGVDGRQRVRACHRRRRHWQSEMGAASVHPPACQGCNVAEVEGRADLRLSRPPSPSPRSLAVGLAKDVQGALVGDSGAGTKLRVEGEGGGESTRECVCG